MYKIGMASRNPGEFAKFGILDQPIGNHDCDGGHKQGNRFIPNRLEPGFGRLNIPLTCKGVTAQSLLAKCG